MIDDSGCVFARHGVAFFWVSFLRAAFLEGALPARDFFFRAAVFGAARFFGGLFPVL